MQKTVPLEVLALAHACAKDDKADRELRHVWIEDGRAFASDGLMVAARTIQAELTDDKGTLAVPADLALLALRAASASEVVTCHLDGKQSVIELHEDHASVAHTSSAEPPEPSARLLGAAMMADPALVLRVADSDTPASVAARVAISTELVAKAAKAAGAKEAIDLAVPSALTGEKRTTAGVRYRLGGTYGVIMPVRLP